jgi:hypothetical protein
LKKSHHIIVVLSVLLVWQCGKTKRALDLGFENGMTGNEVTIDELRPADYVAWVREPENGLVKEKEVGEMKFAMLFKPVDYMICQEERKNEIQALAYQEKLADLGDLEYYDLKIELKNGQEELLKHNLASPQQYTKRVEYYSFEMQKDIVLMNGSDSIPCAMLHFERAYDISPYATFLLAFPKQKSTNENRTIIFRDRVFEKGTLKFQFNKKDLNLIPKLKTA